MNRPLRLGGDFVLTGLAFGLAAFASFAFKMPGTNISLVWLPAGVAVTALWLRGTWLWTAVALAEAVVVVIEGNTPFNVMRVVAANTVAPVVVVLLLRRLRFDAALERFGDVVLLLAVSAVGDVAGAVINAGLRLVERGSTPDDLTRMLNWWLGDMAGVLLIVPVALTWGRAAARQRPSQREIAALAVLLAAVPFLTLIAFRHGPAVLVSVLYLALPIQMWAAARLGPRGGAQAFSVVAGGVLLASVTTLRAPGVDPRSSLVLLDGFLIISASAALIVGALVSEVDRAATALAEAKRFETVRRLAGGLAHDFHNLLTVILGHVDLLRIDRSPHEIEEDLEAIRAAAGRAASITQQLLAYSQQVLLRPTTFAVNDLVGEVAGALGGVLPAGVDCRTDLGEGLPMVRTDRDQLGRVLAQLALRGASAMPQGGTVTFTTRTAFLEGPAHVRGVAVRVSDTGEPFLPETSGGLDPYAGPLPTGPVAQRSSGLEFAMADGFARQVHGRVLLESAQGSGTSITILLPAVAAAD